MEPEGSLPHSQEPATCPYPEPAQLNPFKQLDTLNTSNHIYCGLLSASL
jgi:hypothetical protein